MGRSTVDFDLSVVGEKALIAEQLRLARRLFRLTGELHTFAPRVGEEIEYDIKEAQWRGIHALDIINHRNRHMAMALEQELGLPEPFPIYPFKQHPSRFGFTYQNSKGNYLFTNYHSEYAAKHALDAVLEGKTYKWINRRLIITDDGISIKGENVTDLETIIEYKFKGKEAQWMMPEPYKTYYARLAGNVEAPPSRVSTPTQSPTRTLTPSVERPDGLTPLSDIADELGIDPRDARQILRKHSEKPAWGWAWPANAIEQIRQILRKNRT